MLTQRSLLRVSSVFSRLATHLFVFAACVGGNAIASVEVDHYKEAGFNRGRDYVNQHPAEHIDPFQGNLIRTYTDIYVPGNGGFDYKVQRTYNLLNTVNGDIQSPFGRGWNIHYGRIKRTAFTVCSGQESKAMSLELPDGSSQTFFDSGVLAGTNSADLITSSLWRGRCVSDGIEVHSTDGTKYEFTTTNEIAGLTYGYWLLTKVTDRNGNFATFEYLELPGNRMVIDKVKDRGVNTVFDFAYDQTAGKLVSISGRGSVWQYTVSKANNLASTFLDRVHPPTGGDWVYTYKPDQGPSVGGNFAIDRVTYPLGGTLTYSYAKVQFLNAAGAPVNTVVKQKVSSIDGTWTYDYVPGVGGNYDSTTVTLPSSLGTIKYEHFGYQTSGIGQNTTWKIGLLFRKTTGNNEQVETNTWTSHKISNEGVQRPGYNNFDTTIERPILSERDISRHSTSFRTTFSNFDPYGNPQSIAENGPKDRTRTLSYFNNSTNWFIGFPRNDTIGGIGTEREYFSNGNLQYSQRFGARTTYSYFSDGALSSETNPRNKVTSYSGYVRGVPTSESRGDGAVSISRAVDAATGDITKESDGVADWFYGYDDIGRLASINYPAGSDATITWSGNTRTFSRGGYVATEVFDGFGRRTKVTSDGVYVDFTYDALGRKKSQSLPSSSADIEYDYDLLGRVKQQRSPSELGTLTRSYGYTGTTVTITNERNLPTTYTYDRYADPDQGYLVYIDTPEPGTEVSMVKDVFGHMTSVTQNGVTRTYTLNANKFVEGITGPEGNTTFNPDAVGNIGSKTVGSQTITYGYDGVNRLNSVSYGDSATGTATLTYDGRGAIKTANRSAGDSTAQRTFQYDNNGNLVEDKLVIDGYTFIVGYGRTNVDGLQSITYPSRNGGAGTSVGTVTYDSNLRGLPTRASPYLSSVGHHNSGNLSSITYATSPAQTVTFPENTRQLPSGFYSNALDINLGYSYDKVGNVSGIAYTNDITDNRSMTYDSIDRLKSWGTNKGFDYDGMGNIMDHYEPGFLRQIGYSSATKRAISSTTNGVEIDFDYDSLGNVNEYKDKQSKKVIMALAYDRASQLTCVNCGTANEIRYEYDAKGLRVMEEKNSRKTYFVHGSNNDLLFEYQPYGKIWRKHVYLHGKRVATETDSSATVTTTTLTATPSPASYGDTVTLKAFVTSGAAGSVEFFDGTQSLGSANISGTQAMLLVSAPTIGSHTLKAVYAGDANNQPSTSANVTLVVNKRASATTVSAAAMAALGQSVTITATVNGSNPMGTIEFRNGTTSLGTVALSSGAAQYTLTSALAGTYALNAVYSGDTNHNGSTSPDSQLVVAQGDAVINLTAISPIAVGVRAHIDANLTGPVTPTGTVTFKRGTTAIGGPRPLVNGAVGAGGPNNIPAGSYQLTAEYSGDANYPAKISAPIAFEVTKAQSYTSLSVPSESITAGQPVMLIADVIGYQYITGSVRFYDNGVEIANAPLAPDLRAIVSVSLGAGAHVLKAVYEGDSNNIGSTSAEVTRTVQGSKAVSDFNGDGKSDILWRNALTGEIYLYKMNGLVINAYQSVTNLTDLAYQVAGVGDFNGDGKADVVLRNPANGDVYVWLMNDGMVTSQATINNVPDPTWRIVGTGDFNGDGKSDILWRNSLTGEVWLYLMDGFTITHRGVATLTDLAYQVAGVGDFNGDGKADIVLRNPVNGDVYVWLMNDGVVNSQASINTVPDPAWAIAGIGDFNGDGKSDILWRNGVTGEVWMYMMDGFTITHSAVATLTDLAYQIAGIGDLNGDGKADVVLRSSENGYVYGWLMNGPTVVEQTTITIVPDSAWRIVPAPGGYENKAATINFNADSRSDLLWYNPSTGAAATWQMNGYQILPGSPGIPSPGAGYQPVGAGDFNGDGRTDVLWYRASDRMLYVTLMAQGSVFGEPVSGEIGPIGAGWELRAVADFNGDGRSDILWFNPTTYTASVWPMNGKQILPGGFSVGGSAGFDVLAAGDFNGDGRSDILWYRPSDRTVYLALMGLNGSLPEPQSGVVGQIGAGWEFRAVGDFNGDGRSDIMWFDPNTTTGSVWHMAGKQILAAGLMVVGTAGYEIVGAGDYNGDGRSDVLWYRASDRMLYATMVGHGGTLPEPQSGQIGTIGAGWNLSVDDAPNAPPTISLSVPVLGDPFPAPASIGMSATASDSDGIAVVEFYSNGTKIAEKTSAPFTSTWTNVPAGAYTITARAIDSRGATTVSNAVAVAVNNPANNPPFVTLGPVQSSYVAPATVLLSASAGDSGNGMVTKVEFFNGSTKLHEDMTEPYSFAWQGVPAGTYTVTAVATDNSGLSTTSAAVTFTVGTAVSLTAAPNDLNGDGKSDLVWQHADGSTQAWLMNGTTTISNTTLRPAGSTAAVRFIADFDGDGKADLIWRTPQAPHELWFMSGAQQTGPAMSLPAPDSSWALSQVADLNGDGRTDLIWVQGEGLVQFWLMNGTTTPTISNSVAIPPSMHVKHIGDFNGDGKDDILWLNGGKYVVWYMDGSTVLSALEIPKDGDTAIKKVGDFNGDGKTDLLWQTDTGTVSIWLANQIGSSSGFDAAVQIANATGLVVTHVADFNGDGKADLLWKNAQGAVSMWIMNGVAAPSTSEVVAAGSGWFVQEVADFNGDGKSDLMLGHADGTDVLQLMNGTVILSQVAITQAGNGWVPVPGDGTVVAPNTPPTISLALSTTGTVFEYGTDAELVATAADPDPNGSVEAVRFYSGSTEIGSSYTPFRLSLSSLEPGSYSVTAIASDDNGATAVSNAVQFTIIAQSESDFNRNGTSDLLWERADGRTDIWLMNGVAIAASTSIQAAGSGWRVKLVDDFNGDGKADLVWEHTSGNTDIWLMDGMAAQSFARVQDGGLGWSVKHTGDFNGDGKADYLREHTNGATDMVLMNGLTALTTQNIKPAGSGWSAKAIADFDGDGKDDIVWRHADGRALVSLMNGTSVAAEDILLTADPAWTLVHTGDFNGDGRADMVWRHADGRAVIWLMDGLTTLESVAIMGQTPEWTLSLVGDLDGDGKSDLIWRNADGQVTAWFMDGGTVTSTTIFLAAGSGWTPVRLRDFNGDRKADLLFRHEDGRALIWLQNGATTIASGTILGPAPEWSVAPQE